MSDFGAFGALLHDTMSSPAVPTERLELIAKKAAADYVSSGVPLSETITKSASSMPGVNHEHIKRMCEIANQNTFNALFKSASGDVRAPEFEVADPADIQLGLSKEAAAVPTVTQADVDYATPPTQFVKAAGVAVQEKIASAPTPIRPVTPAAFPFNEAMTARSKLATADKKFASDVGKYEMMLQGANELLVTKVAQALEDGNTPEEVVTVCLHVDPSYEGQKLAAETLIAASKVAGIKTASVSSVALDRIDGLEVDENNPICRAFGATREMHLKIAEAKKGREILRTQRSKLDGFLRDHVR